MKMYPLACFITVTVFLFTLEGCSKKDDPTPAASPSISKISPENGPKNTAVTIDGENFGTNASNVKVSFNGAAATIQSVSNTSIVALVPAKAGTGKVTVSVGSKSVDGPVFNYEFSATVTTLAGGNFVGDFADGKGNDAKFDSPIGIAVDNHNNVYVADDANYSIRKVTQEGVVTTVAGSYTMQGHTNGSASSALFYTARDLAIDTISNMLYVADWGSNAVRRITLDNLQASDAVSNFAGGENVGFKDGPIADSKFYAPNAVATDGQGNVYVIDEENFRVRKISDGVVSTLAGSGVQGYVDGAASDSKIGDWAPAGVAVGADGVVYFTDRYSLYSTLRKISGNHVSSIVDDQGDDVYDGFFGIAVDRNGNVFVADQNNCIRMVTPDGVVSVIAGMPNATEGLVDGVGSAARFHGPEDIAIDKNGNLYVADTGNNAIRKIVIE